MQSQVCIAVYIYRFADELLSEQVQRVQKRYLLRTPVFTPNINRISLGTSCKGI